MTQINTLNDDETKTRCLPGAARFLAISAAYLSAEPAAVGSTARNDCVPGANCSIPAARTEYTGARL